MREVRVNEGRAIDLPTEEAEALKQTLENFSDDYRFAETLMKHLNAGTALLGQWTASSAELEARRALLVTHINSLRWALELLAKGYMRQSLALLRMAYEHVSWARADRAAMAPLLGRKSNKKSDRPKAFISETFQKEEAGGLIWDWLSEWAHPRRLALLAEARPDESGAMPNVGPAWTEFNFLHGFHFFIAAAGAGFRAVEVLQEEVLGAADAKWRREAASMVRQVEKRTAEIAARSKALAAELKVAKVEGLEVD
jgi:hypothetical protein